MIIKNWEKQGQIWVNKKAKGNQTRAIWIGYSERLIAGKPMSRYTIWIADKTNKMTLDHYTTNKDAQKRIVQFMKNNTY
jgi:hypothetical protein